MISRSAAACPAVPLTTHSSGDTAAEIPAFLRSLGALGWLSGSGGDSTPDLHYKVSDIGVMPPARVGKCDAPPHRIGGA